MSYERIAEKYQYEEEIEEIEEEEEEEWDRTDISEAEYWKMIGKCCPSDRQHYMGAWGCDLCDDDGGECLSNIRDEWRDQYGNYSNVLHYFWNEKNLCEE